MLGYFALPASIYFPLIKFELPNPSPSSWMTMGPVKFVYSGTIFIMFGDIFREWRIKWESDNVVHSGKVVFSTIDLGLK